MAPWSRVAAPIYKNTGSVARDHLASERTYLAWTRTGLGFVALGIAVERFSRFELLDSHDSKLQPKSEKDDDIKDQPGSRILVGILLTLGTGSMLYATKRYFSVLRLLEKGEFRPAYHGVAAMGAAMAALGAGVFAGTANGWRRERQAAQGSQ
ncbi:Fc.00g073070.m01.CDS01 [Cosmosporella sp. VM-42]